MNKDHRPSQPTRARQLGVPSRRAVGALMAGALTIGLLAGALISPAPPSSQASNSNMLTRLLTLLATRTGASPPQTAPAAQPTAATTEMAHAPRKPSATPTALPPNKSTATPRKPLNSQGSSPAGPAENPEEKPTRLPPISHVWLIVLDGDRLDQTIASTTPYPYLTGQLLKEGTLLERYSAIEASELAGDAALLTGGVGESLSTISQTCDATPTDGQTSTTAPTKPHSTPTTTCASANQAGGQADADAFLQRTVPSILSNSAYLERGLIVITFGSTAQEQRLSLTTLDSTGPGGALLLSPALKAGRRNSEAFDSLAPRTSLEAIFADP